MQGEFLSELSHIILDVAKGEHSPSLGEEREAAVVVPQDLQPVTWNKGLAQAELVRRATTL